MLASGPLVELIKPKGYLDVEKKVEKVEVEKIAPSSNLYFESFLHKTVRVQVCVVDSLLLVFFTVHAKNMNSGQFYSFSSKHVDSPPNKLYEYHTVTTFNKSYN